LIDDQGYLENDAAPNRARHRAFECREAERAAEA
jgi:hypothetical protein